MEVYERNREIKEEMELKVYEKGCRNIRRNEIGGI